MCLCVSPNSDEVVQKLRKKNKPVYAYKAMILDEYTHNGKSYKYYVGVYRKTFKYGQGLNVSNRKLSNLTALEKQSKSVFKGFHCYSRLIDAFYHEYHTWCDCHIFRVEIDPKDIVAVGTSGPLKSIVCKKFKVDLEKPSKKPSKLIRS